MSIKNVVGKNKKEQHDDKLWEIMDEVAKHPGSPAIVLKNLADKKVKKYTSEEILDSMKPYLAMWEDALKEDKKLYLQCIAESEDPWSFYWECFCGIPENETTFVCALNDLPFFGWLNAEVKHALKRGKPYNDGYAQKRAGLNPKYLITMLKEFIFIQGVTQETRDLMNGYRSNSVKTHMPYAGSKLSGEKLEKAILKPLEKWSTVREDLYGEVIEAGTSGSLERFREKMDEFSCHEEDTLGFIATLMSNIEPRYFKTFIYDFDDSPMILDCCLAWGDKEIREYAKESLKEIEEYLDEDGEYNEYY